MNVTVRFWRLTFNKYDLPSFKDGVCDEANYKKKRINK